MDERQKDKDAEGTATEGDEDDNKSEPGPRRCGSPAVSVASAVLEWDPSADVGAMASSSSEMMRPPGPSQSNQRSVLEGFSECDIVYGPKMYELEGGNGRSRPGSRRAQHQKLKGCDSSTPSSSPAPLGDLQYSPVIPQSSYSHEHNTVAQAESSVAQNIGAGNNPGSKQGSSDEDNNNDDLTEGRRTPGRAVSESSTDWEYDPEKNDHTKSLSNWQTSGVTRSEIEYQTRKKNGSSTSIASSVLMLKVEAKVSSPDQGSPSNKRKKNKQPLSSSSHGNTEDSSDFDRRLKKILQEREARRKKQAQEATTSTSDPSTMCGLVGDYVDMLEELDSSKENLQYDVLKKHREYHLAKVRNQIATVEKLNLKLLEVERERRRYFRKIEEHYLQDRKGGGGGDADHRRRNKRDAEEGAAANHQHVLSMRDEAVAQLTEYFRKQEELARKEKARKSQRKEYSSDPMMGSESARMLRNIPTNFQESARGLSMPYLPTKTSESKESDRRRPVSKREEDNLDQRKQPKVRARESFLKPVALPPKPVREESSGVRQRKKDPKYGGISNPILRELISKILEPEELHQQSDRKKTSSRRFSEKASSSDDRTETEEEGSGSRASAREFANRRGARGRSDRSRKEKIPRDKKVIPEVPKPKKPPVGFFVPLSCDDNGISAPGSGNKNQQYKWLGDQKGENGLYDVKAPMSVHDCLKQNKPDCFENIKERDDIILHRKLDRKIRHETFIGQFLDSDLQNEEVDDYMDNYFLKCDPDQEKRAMYYMERYEKAKAHGVPDGRRLISSKEMRERTARFLIYDALAKQKKEALERKKQAIRNSQRKFSNNLRRYQQMRNVNIPDQFELNFFK